MFAGRVPVVCRSGPDPVLSGDEEKRLVKLALNICSVGYPVTRNDLMTTVRVIRDKQKRNIPFKDNIPGMDWIYGLLKSHPEFSERCSQALGN